MTDPDEIEDLDVWLKKEREKAVADGQNIDRPEPEPRPLTDSDIAIWRLWGEHIRRLPL